MDPSDVALLLVPGTADADATPLEDVCSTARLITPQDWQPTSDVIGATVERAIRDALVVRIDGAHDTTPLLKTSSGGPLPQVAE